MARRESGALKIIVANWSKGNSDRSDLLSCNFPSVFVGKEEDTELLKMGVAFHYTEEKAFDSLKTETENGSRKIRCS